MPKFSDSSQSKLRTCDFALQRVFNEVIKTYDCTIIFGARSDIDQKRLFKEGKSKLDGVTKKSKHQTNSDHPYALAVDAAPFPIDWNDIPRFHDFAKHVFKVADGLGVKLRWGGDWDGDGDTKDQTFNDLPHFELI